MRRAIRIGVTGMLGSGKSTLIAIMAARGMRVINSDKLARELMETNAVLRAKLIEVLGPEAYSATEGTSGSVRLNRDYVASRIFSDSSLRKQVESVVHPVVTSEIENIFHENRDDRPVAVESALILQSKFRERFDYIALIEAPKDASIERAISAGRMTRQDATARFEEQSRDRPDRGEADFIIDNSCKKEDFEKRCEALIDVLEAIEGRDLPPEPLHSLPA